MFCERCGTANDDGNAWCTGCGTSLNAVAPQAGRHPESSFPPPPPVLAAPASVFCISCGHTLEPHVKFCTSCGEDQDRLIPAPVESPVQSSPSVAPVPSTVLTPVAPNSAPPPAPAAQSCISCGQKLEPDTRFCVACGANQTWQDRAPFAAPLQDPPPMAPPPPLSPSVPAPVTQSQTPAPAAASLFCFSCGQALDAEIRFCTKCGADQTQVDTPPPPEPDFQTDKTAPKRFEEAPSGLAPAFCIACGSRMEAGTRFCAGCGADQDRPQESPSASSIFAPPSPEAEVARQAPYGPAAAAPSPGTGPRAAGRPLLTIVLCAVFLGVLGAGGFLAYRNMGAIKGLLSRWLPGKPQSTGGSQTAAGQPPDSAAQTQPPAAIPDTTPPQVSPAAGAAGVNPPSQNQPAAAQAVSVKPAEPDRPAPGTRPPVPAILPATEIPARPPATNIGAPKVTPPGSDKPLVVAAEEKVKPKTEIQTVREAVPAKQDAAVTPPPVPATPPAERKPPAPPVEPRGVIQWTGEAAKDQTLIIEGGIASFGAASGKLPGVPCFVTVQPAEISIAEAPGPSNGFARIVLRFPKKGRFTVTIQWETLR